MKWAELTCQKCNQPMVRAGRAKYCLSCSVEVARAKQAAWYRAYRQKQKLAREAAKEANT